MRVLVTGSSGLIGSALCSALEARGDEVVRLVRRQPARSEEAFWDPAAGDLDRRVVEGLDAVVHLAGAGIGDKRWSESRRRLIADSRTIPTRLLAERLAAAEDKPSVFISASAIGFYGNRTEPVDESSPPADPPDFLSTVVVDWERSTEPAENAGIPTTHIRTGIVLSDKGGALAKLLIPFRAGFGGKLGAGDAWWSWITLADEIRAIQHLIDNRIPGAVNLTSPNPVTNAELTKVLGAVLGRPTIFAVPRFVLDAALGKDLAQSILFTSSQVMPARLQDSGFVFDHAEIEPALRSILEPEQEEG